MYDGVINVYKEKGYTSFEVIARLRGILKQKKIGHTGTLDPDAEGVLVVCIGSATKLCDLLTDKDKSYEAVLLLGKTTDTEDSSGKIISESEVNVSENEVRKTIMSFVGEYDQIPPMYSAIKINGKKLYELARQGIEIERQPRRVVIHDIDISDISLPYVRFSVKCGKGTYIRSLCRDIGEKLCCGGIMDSLVRSSVNVSDTGFDFLLEDAIKLDDIEKLEIEGRLAEHILTIDKLFPKLSRVCVKEQGARKLLNGNILGSNDIIKDISDDIRFDSLPQEHDGDKCLVYDHVGTFKAIYSYDKKINAWKAWKMFL